MTDHSSQLRGPNPIPTEGGPLTGTNKQRFDGSLLLSAAGHMDYIETGGRHTHRQHTRTHTHTNVMAVLSKYTIVRYLLVTSFHMRQKKTDKYDAVELHT